MLNISFQDFLTYFAIIITIFTLITINPIYSVLGLILILIITSSYLLSLSITFLGLSYLIIYVGAIAILFIFIIMMMNIHFFNFIDNFFTSHLPIIIFIIFILELIITKYGLTNEYLKNDIKSILIDNEINWDNLLLSLKEIEILGNNLYSHLGILLFIMGLILLIGMIGPIILCL